MSVVRTQFNPLDGRWYSIVDGQAEGFGHSHAKVAAVAMGAARATALGVKHEVCEEGASRVEQTAAA